MTSGRLTPLFIWQRARDVWRALTARKKIMLQFHLIVQQVVNACETIQIMLRMKKKKKEESFINFIIYKININKIKKIKLKN